MFKRALTYDVAVVGGGPGGYVAAIKAAQLGLKTLCIDARPTLGGTCLNVGCIPSKALLHSSMLYNETTNLAKFGIECSAKLDLAKMLAQKDDAVSGLTKGIAMLFKKNGVDFIHGRAAFTAKGTLSVNKETVSSKTIVLAMGSEASTIPGVEIDERRIVTSTGALSLASVPQRMAVIGGGAIGLELGCVWSRLGAKVSVIEATLNIGGPMDRQVSDALKRIPEKQGLSFSLGSTVDSVKRNGDEVEVSVNGQKSTFDVVLVATGRRPNTSNMGLDIAGVQLDPKGRVVVNSALLTSMPNVYAIGDCIVGPMLAHKAEEEGIAVAETISGRKGHVNYGAIPSVVYTHPEVASVGMTEEQLKEDGVAYKIGHFNYAANSRARTVLDSSGFVKVLVDANDRILGAHIISPNAGEAIAELVLAIEYGASSEDVARTCHAHPTLSEAIKEACLAAHSKPIHS